MSTFAFAGPLGPGKADELRQFASEALGPRKAEHDDYMQRYNLTKEYGWIQSSSQGDMYIAYRESTTDYLGENRKFAASTHPFDTWYKQQVGAILGADLNQPLPPGFIETVFEAHAPQTGGREQPAALAVPVLTGQADRVREAARELSGPRASDLQDYFRRLATSMEAWYLQHTPQGDWWIYYAEGDDPPTAFRQFGQSQEPFDVYRKQLILDVSGFDFNQPVTPPELVFKATAPVPAGVKY